MTKEQFETLNNPPQNWHTTENVRPCEQEIEGKQCGKTTEFMYPIFGKFVCDEHRGTYMGMPLCCTHCFEPYWPNYPERAQDCGEKWSGHCFKVNFCCHDRDRKVITDHWKQEGDGALKEIELSVSATGNPMIVINTERNHYTIYWNQKHELFRAYADKGGKYLNHFKLQRDSWEHAANEAIDLVSFFNGMRDVTKHRPKTQLESGEYVGHELKVPPHTEGSGDSCEYQCNKE